MKKLKLNKLTENGLSKKEMNNLLGGAGKPCGCACLFTEQVGSSRQDNGLASYKINNGYPMDPPPATIADKGGF